MTVTNLTTKQPDHVKIMAHFALDALNAAATTMVDESDPKKGIVQIRVGFHSGPVASHVIGQNNPRYSIIGDSKLYFRICFKASHVQSGYSSSRQCRFPYGEPLKSR